MAELLNIEKKAKYGSVREISAVDYVDEVNKAGDDVWVVLHLYKSGYATTYIIQTVQMATPEPMWLGNTDKQFVHSLVYIDNTFVCCYWNQKTSCLVNRSD